MAEHLAERLVLSFTVGGVTVAFNLTTMLVSWVVIVLLVALALVLRRGLRQEVEDKPNRIQATVDVIMDVLQSQLLAGFGSDRVARALFPFIGTIFLYVLFCNWIAIVPYLPSPTEDLNVTLSLGIMVLVMTHGVAMRFRGVRHHLKGLLEPLPFLLPLHLMGDIGRTTSHSFRLFGNLYGGAILVAVFSTSLVPLVVPVGLNLFFGLFVGLIQAFVFSMLAVIYINTAVTE